MFQTTNQWAMVSTVLLNYQRVMGDLHDFHLEIR